MKRKSSIHVSAIPKTEKPASRTAANAVTFSSLEEVESKLLTVRERVARIPSRHWKQSLEKNLIEEGITPAKARELVELAAS
jgi:hypothetical protein